MSSFILALFISSATLAATVTTPKIEGKVANSEGLEWNASLKKALMLWECYDGSQPEKVLSTKKAEVKVSKGRFTFPSYRWSCASGDSQRVFVRFSLSGAAQIAVMGFNSTLNYGTDESKYRPLSEMAQDLSSITFYYLPFDSMEFQLASGKPLGDLVPKFCTGNQKTCTTFVTEAQADLIDPTGRIHAGRPMKVAWGTSRGRFPKPVMNAHFLVGPTGEAIQVLHHAVVTAMLTDKASKTVSTSKIVAQASATLDLPAAHWPTNTRRLLIQDADIPLP